MTTSDATPSAIERSPMNRSWPSLNSIEFAKRLAPDAGCRERQDAFDDQQQRNGRPQRVHNELP